MRAPIQRFETGEGPSLQRYGGGNDEATAPGRHRHPRDEAIPTPKKEKPPNNPLVRGISEFCRVLQDRHTENEDTFSPMSPPASDMPKRYTLYPPLLLLPANFTTQNPRWTAFYQALGESDNMELFRVIAEKGFKGMAVSRIAINAPIAAEIEERRGDDGFAGGGGGAGDFYRVEEDTIRQNDASTTKEQNVLRCPSGLLPVYGDWGPMPDHDDRQQKHRGRILHPTVQDFDAAFWTSTSQLQGIAQCWAPLYTMFSRGNISEKARILGLQSHFPGLAESELNQPIGDVDVVDFYIGIGYFAFCYLSRGVRRVYGWDINSWSIEGLRRGCERNGWRCLVVRVGEAGSLQGSGSVRDLVEEIARGDHADNREAAVRCVAFLGDNKWAWKVLKEMQHECARIDNNEGRVGSRFNVRHANLGLLPSSRASWQEALQAITGLSEGGTGGWLHVHENVDVREIDAMKLDIVRDIDGLVKREPGCPRTVSCPHVQQVKTYAPGVMHCVFDVEIKPNG
ncbi:uncharacterized protein A1O5_02044 [Cladophialophora psammophila CBS 110553]|uniref:tRNA(Phe) (4-demethylwyosine(37)-C(7)) aminocarboxypropyltransferase n=1 Tax=Cladophialophora psammophila CBS 110553 TaxID=1182543 RepID=W9X599_9EURO|nr:uncharacterized protein A1O5_02044 [Cladophialophora psammophila CBS 110553]EXJ75348.1 hypothetical protein A1O5_02044 [Cladophialophora psammophila CBS 110553]